MHICLLFILASFMPPFLNAMNKPHVAFSQAEALFLITVLKVRNYSDFDSINEKEKQFQARNSCLKPHLERKKKIETRRTQLQTLKNEATHQQLDLITQEEAELANEMWRMSYEENLFRPNPWEEQQLEQLKEEKERYDQFFIWILKPPSTRLTDIKFLFSKMAEENNCEGMQAIEALALEWKLINNPDEKLEKLDYYDALQEAVNQGGSAATHYLLEKKNISLKNFPATLVLKVCKGNWGKNASYSSYGGGETLQKNIVQLMIKKGVPSSIDNIRDYLGAARNTDASDRLINYLQEVEISRRNS